MVFKFPGGLPPRGPPAPQWIEKKPFVLQPESFFNPMAGWHPPKKIQERWTFSSPMSFKNAHPPLKIRDFFSAMLFVSAWLFLSELTPPD